MVRVSHRSSEGCSFDPRLRLRNRFSEDIVWRTFIYHSRYLQAPTYPKYLYVGPYISPVKLSLDLHQQAKLADSYQARELSRQWIAVEREEEGIYFHPVFNIAETIVDSHVNVMFDCTFPSASLLDIIFC